MQSHNFIHLALRSELQAAIKQLGYAKMTPIQATSIPLLLEGYDLIGRSQTGTGKTAAFALPILQKINATEKHPQALILAPTRELCEQILQEIKKLSNGLAGVLSMTLVGGQSAAAQMNLLNLGAQVIVGTPGRTLEFLNNRNFDPRRLKTLVLDEADRMLDEGFTEEVAQIIDLLPTDRQTVFFSATYPESIDLLSRTYQKNPKTVSALTETDSGPQIKQFLYSGEKAEKIRMLMNILGQHPANSVLIFCRMKVTVDEINDLLNEAGVATRAIHGDLEQAQRNQTMALFRSGSLRVLVATDIAARGIDIDHLELVINFDLPSSPDVYLHRIGRTGRAGKTGTAVSIAEPAESLKVSAIEAAIGESLIRDELNSEKTTAVTSLLQQPKMKTIYISGGRKDKIRAGDIVGALTSAPTIISATDIGKIDLHDTFTYVAVSFEFAEKVLQKLSSSKIKGRKFKVSYVK
ncbi:MAG: ATP-dependent RNA helicase DbpA [Bdellovibrionota bacterium]